MKFIVLKVFKDKINGARYEPGDIFETDDAKRAGKNQKKGLISVEIIEKSSNRQAQKKPDDKDRSE